MRKALETLLKLANDHALDSKKPEFAGPPEALTACQIEALKMRYGEMSWAEAKATAEGEVLPAKGDRDEEIEREAVRIANRLVKEFGGKNLRHRIEAYARALVIYDEAIPQQLVQTPAWEDYWEDFRSIIDENIESR